jgi:hypothetical protein
MRSLLLLAALALFATSAHAQTAATAPKHTHRSMQQRFERRM